MTYARSTSTTLQWPRLVLLASAFLVAMPAYGKGSVPLRPYSIHDTDGDGFLSREEYWVLLELRRARHQQRGRLTIQPAPAFDEVDVNGDGRIEEQELTQALRHKMHRYRHRGPVWR